MSDTIKAVITVKEAVDKGRTIQIIDSNKQKFTLWKEKSTGGMNPTFQAYQTFGGVGSNIAIEYVEKQKSFLGSEGKQVAYTERTLWSVSGSGGQNPTQPSYVAPSAPQSVPEPSWQANNKALQDAHGKRLALHGFVNARLVNHTIAQVKTEVEQLLELEDFMEEKLNKTPELTIHLPETVEDTSQAINVEDIPF